MDRRGIEPTQDKPRLVLVTPTIENAARFAPVLAAACAAADIAAVILRLAPAGESEQTARIQTLAPAAQEAGAALLLDEASALVAATNADGVHVHDREAVQPARAALGKDRIVGAGGLASRDDAMTAGEAGADYVLFGEPENGRRPSLPALVERVSWWAELFVIPCVAYAALRNEIAPLADAGADFIALGEETVWNAPEGPAAALAAAAIELDAKEPAQ